MAQRVTRSKSVRIRLSEDELVSLSTFSREHGLTKSEVLRRLAREVTGFGPTFDGEVRDVIREYARQLKIEYIEPRIGFLDSIRLKGN